MSRDITEPLPYELGAAASSGERFTANKHSYDLAVGGVPFRLAASDKFPYERSTAPFRKDQFDNSPEPGEQTLDGWWIRSQSSFHLGAGIRFLEPTSDETITRRFVSSQGVDVWTPGEVSLLRRTAAGVTGSGEVRLVGRRTTTDGYLIAAGSALKTDAGATVSWGGSTAILDLVDDGANYYAVDNTGIYRGALTGGSGTKIWDNSSSVVKLGWAKQRLVAGIDNKVYELVTGGTALPATPNYTHPVTSWRWTSFADTPGAILAAGYAGSRSAIYKFTLDTTGLMPTLDSATIAAELPEGEVVHSIYAYLGAYLAIGTNKGVRIAVISTAGEVQYGPLTLETDEPVRAFVGSDSYVFAVVEDFIDGDSGLVRIDLGQQVDDLRFPWATDLQAKVSGTPRSVVMLGTSGRKVIGVDGSGAFVESAGELEPTGWLETGKIRFNTLEPKNFRRARVRGVVTDGSIAVSQVIDSTALSIMTFTSDTSLDQEVNLPGPRGLEFTAMRFDLARSGTDNTAGPTLTGYQIKAVPAPMLQQLWRLPFMCFDFEKDKFGNQEGRPGWARERESALRELEATRDIVRIQDLNDNTSTSAFIEEVTFQSVTPPKSPASNAGGILYVTVRTI